MSCYIVSSFASVYAIKCALYVPAHPLFLRSRVHGVQEMTTLKRGEEESSQGHHKLYLSDENIPGST